jgi:hypothetical protein
MHKELLAGYGFKLIARVWIEDDKFRIDVTDTEAEKLSYSVYAFVIDGEIVRIGSSAAQLKRRLAAWRRDISVALAGGKSAAPLTEAEQWRKGLHPNAQGELYARQATMVETPVGKFHALLDEERTLIARYKPRINRSSR